MKWISKGEAAHRAAFTDMTMRYFLGIFLVAGLLGACAQVPKEAVQLSTTVGRDVAEAHRSHRETTVLLFARMKDDVNTFVDDVYAPFILRELLAGEKADTKALLAEGELTVFSALEIASSSRRMKGA